MKVPADGMRSLPPKPPAKFRAEEDDKRKKKAPMPAKMPAKKC